MMIDLKDQVFDRWTVLQFEGMSVSRHALWKCRCQCGTEKKEVASRTQTCVLRMRLYNA
jgi:hypothetical protein